MSERTYSYHYQFKGMTEDGELAIFELDAPEEILHPIPSREEWERTHGKGA